MIKYTYITYSNIEGRSKQAERIEKCSSVNSVAHARIHVCFTRLYFLCCPHRFPHLKIFCTSPYSDFILKFTYFYLFYLEFNTVVFFLFLNLSFHHLSKKPHLRQLSLHLAEYAKCRLWQVPHQLIPYGPDFFLLKLFQVFIQISLCIYQYFSQAS